MIFIPEMSMNMFVICRIAAILSRPQYVNAEIEDKTNGYSKL